MAAGVRAARPSDGARLADIYGPVVRDTAISFELDPPDAAEMSRRVEGTLRSWPWIVVADGDDVAGYAYASAHGSRAAYRWSAEVSVYVASAARGTGVGRRLYGALLELIARQGCRSVYAGITLPNVASVSFHEALGFAAVGTFARAGFKQGRWWDVGWWQRSLRADDAEPDEPVPFSELQSGIEWSRW